MPLVYGHSTCEANCIDPINGHQNPHSSVLNFGHWSGLVVD